MGDSNRFYSADIIANTVYKNATGFVSTVSDSFAQAGAPATKSVKVEFEKFKGYGEKLQQDFRKFTDVQKKYRNILFIHNKYLSQC